MSRQPYTEVVEPDENEPEEDFHATDVDEIEVRHVRPRWYVEDGMGKRIVGVVVAALVLGLLWYAYQRHLASQANDGSITTDDTTARVVPENTPDPPVPKKPFVPAATITPVASTPAAIPASDSIAPNPTNGMTFAGSGKFQVYRQGNLTWRVDTETGKTCIVFATMEEWKKPIVYEHGCATS